MNKNSPLILIPLGLLVVVIGQVISHFFKIPDYLQGTFTGTGLGMMFVSLVRKKPETEGYH